MNLPSSSSSSPPDLSIVPRNSIGNCQVCGKTGHGKHFGAITCRACAAFFRRFGISNSLNACKNNNKCEVPKNGYFACKQCRLKRCWSIGMTIDNFQFDRDSFYHKKAKAISLQNKIPQSMDTFLKRSNLILYCARESDSENEPKYYIDVKFLIDKANEILEKGSETPLYAPNSLEKLALGLRILQENASKKTKIITKVGKDGVFALWENEITRVAKWLTYFDEFQQLPHQLQLDLLKGMWKVWNRLEKLATTALARRQKLCGNNMIMGFMEKNAIICNYKSIEVDISWCSKYTFEQLKFFDSHDAGKRLDGLIQLMLDLQPTDVELSYMLCQLCFHQVGKLHQGEILDVVERFQEKLSNNLHDYYVNRLNTSKYSMRIASMMKVNNALQQCIYQDKVKSELMRVFDIFFAKYSHPDLFMTP